MKKLLFLILCLGPCIKASSQSPGNVSTNLRWWLKANTGVYINNGTTLAVDGQAVQQWNDQSTIANHAQQTVAGNKPIYKTAIINNNAVLRFSSNQFIDGLNVSGIGPAESFYMFMVFKQNSWVAGGTGDGSGTFIIDRPSPTNELTSFKMVNTNKYFYQRRQDDGGNLGGPISTSVANTTSFVILDYFRNFPPKEEGIHLNGKLDVLNTGAPGGNITGPIIRIGRHADKTNGGLNGDFAEMIVYNADLSATDHRKVETYLAIKYGITLDPSINYLRSDGAVIYPVTSSHSGYANDIAGIGRDDNSALNQPNSKSQNSDAVVRVYGAGDLTNDEFLIWGNNDGNLTSPNNVDVHPTIDRRLSRVWRFAETGDVGNVNIEFDLSAVPGPKVSADLRLLIDRDGDGFFDNDIAPKTGTLVGNIFTVTGVDVQTGDYFTVGTVNENTTPLPVELADFDVNYENPAVVASWKTATELNNDYFTLERAGEDLNFLEVVREPGGGTTKEPHTYSTIDPYPYEGKSYYRLKQTDYDGNSSYSDTRYIFIESKHKELTVYPNPNDGKMLNFRLGTTPFQLRQVEVFNQKGVSLEKKTISGNNIREYAVELERRLSPGLYLIRVNFNGKTEFHKLIVP